VNNPTPIPGASSTANWRCRKVESIVKRCVCALALILLFTAVTVGSVPSRQATAQESSPTTTLSSQPNADGWDKGGGTPTLRARHKAH
jgi:hypothetical protein